MLALPTLSPVLLGSLAAQQAALRALLRAQAAAIYGFENSGALGADSGPNGITLTNNNVVTQVAGKGGFAANLVRATSQSLSVADNATLSMGAGVSFTLAGWINLATNPGTQGICTKWNGAAGAREYCLYYGVTANRFNFIVSDGTTETQLDANSFGAVTLGAWNFVVATLDLAAQRMTIQVNNGPVDSAVRTQPCQDGTNAFRLGVDQGASFVDGKLDEWLVLKRPLTVIEVATLYNNGAGMAL